MYIHIYLYIKNCKCSVCVYVFTSICLFLVYINMHIVIYIYGCVYGCMHLSISLSCWVDRQELSLIHSFSSNSFSHLPPSVSFLIQLRRLPITNDTLIPPVFLLSGGCLYRPFSVISLVSFSIAHQMHSNLSSFTESPMNSPWMYPRLALFLIHSFFRCPFYDRLGSTSNSSN